MLIISINSILKCFANIEEYCLLCKRRLVSFLTYRAFTSTVSIGNPCNPFMTSTTFPPHFFMTFVCYIRRLQALIFIIIPFK